VTASVCKASVGKSSRTSKRKTTSFTKKYRKNFKKFLQNLPQGDSDGGSDLDESPSYVQRKRKAGSKTAEIWENAKVFYLLSFARFSGRDAATA